MKEPRIDNMVKMCALLMLQGRPKHGYDLIKTISDRTGKNVSAGQIYPFLKQLQKLGYVKVKAKGSRERKSYVLTPKGRKFSKDMIERFGLMMDMAVRNRLKTCAHCGCEIYKGGHSEKIRGKMSYFCCASCAKAYRKS